VIDYAERRYDRWNNEGDMIPCSRGQWTSSSRNVRRFPKGARFPRLPKSQVCRSRQRESANRAKCISLMRAHARLIPSNRRVRERGGGHVQFFNNRCVKLVANYRSLKSSSSSTRDSRQNCLKSAGERYIYLVVVYSFRSFELVEPACSIASLEFIRK